MSASQHHYFTCDSVQNQSRFSCLSVVVFPFMVSVVTLWHYRYFCYAPFWVSFEAANTVPRRIIRDWSAPSLPLLLPPKRSLPPLCSPDACIRPHLCLCYTQHKWGSGAWVGFLGTTLIQILMFKGGYWICWSPCLTLMSTLWYPPSFFKCQWNNEV